MIFNREQLGGRLAALAARGVHIGTSSWKYTGWCGSLYDTARYEYRGKFSETRFNRDCLTEYSEVFKTVCVDAAYYAFPTPRQLEGLDRQTPADFRFTFKVTDAITIRKFPLLDRFGDLAGKPNGNFLNAGLFTESFLKPCEAIRSKVGLLIFEFSRFHPADYPQGREFVADLDRFLGQLPSGWPYGVEMRNRNWLKPPYFECLARHQTAHVFNSWDAMPPVEEQMALPGSRTNPSLVAARFLLKPGRNYQEAVTAFAPYDAIREEYPAARAAAKTLIDEAQTPEPKRATFIYVNNRLEGNALATITAMVEPV